MLRVALGEILVEVHAKSVASRAEMSEAKLRTLWRRYFAKQSNLVDERYEIRTLLGRTSQRASACCTSFHAANFFSAKRSLLSSQRIGNGVFFVFRGDDRLTEDCVSHAGTLTHSIFRGFRAI